MRKMDGIETVKHEKSHTGYTCCAPISVTASLNYLQNYTTLGVGYTDKLGNICSSCLIIPSNSSSLQSEEKEINQHTSESQQVVVKESCF